MEDCVEELMKLRAKKNAIYARRTLEDQRRFAEDSTIRQMTEREDMLVKQMAELNLGAIPPPGKAAMVKALATCALDSEWREKSVNQDGFQIGDRVKEKKRASSAKKAKVGTVVDLTECYIYVTMDGEPTSPRRRHSSAWKRVKSEKIIPDIILPGRSWNKSKVTVPDPAPRSFW